MNAPRAAAVRFPVDPGDVSPEKAARRLHLTLAQFEDVLPKLLARGFPPADPDTGMYDLEAIDRWRHLRNPRFFPELVAPARSESDDEAARRGMMERTNEMSRRRAEARTASPPQGRRRGSPSGRD